MTSMQPTPIQSLAELIRQLIQTARHEYEDASRELVQVTVWVVALATGLLSVSVFSGRVLSSLGPRERVLLVLLLLGAILLGVVQRICQHITNQLAAAHLRALSTRLVGLASTLSGTTPPTPEALLTPGAVVTACKEHFGLDYTFLLTSNRDLAACQSAYRAQFDLWQSAEQRRKDDLAKVLVAFSGKPEKSAADIWEGSNDLEGPRQQARHVIRLGWVVFGLFLGMTGSFVTAMVLLSLGLLHQPAP